MVEGREATCCMDKYVDNSGKCAELTGSSPEQEVFLHLQDRD